MGTLVAGTIFPTIYTYYAPSRRFQRGDREANLETLIERFFGIVWRGLEPL